MINLEWAHFYFVTKSRRLQMFKKKHLKAMFFIVDKRIYNKVSIKKLSLNKSVLVKAMINEVF